MLPVPQALQCEIPSEAEALRVLPQLFSIDRLRENVIDLEIPERHGFLAVEAPATICAPQSDSECALCHGGSLEEKGLIYPAQTELLIIGQSAGDGKRCLVRSLSRAGAELGLDRVLRLGGRSCGCSGRCRSGRGGRSRMIGSAQQGWGGPLAPAASLGSHGYS